MIFIYDQVRLSGNIGTMIRNLDVSSSNKRIIQVIMSPENELKQNTYNTLQTIVVLIIYYIAKLFRIVVNIPTNCIYRDSDGKFNARMKSTIRRFSCVSKKDRVKPNLWYDPENIVEFLKDPKYKIYILENYPQSVNLYSLDGSKMDENTVFIFGSERYGVSDKFLDLPHTVVSIPTFKNTCYNVSCAHAIVCSWLFKGI